MYNKLLFNKVSKGNKLNIKSENSLTTLIIMARWPGFGRCKNRLANKIGTKNAAVIQKKLNNHTIEVARSLEERGLIKVQFAVSGVGQNAIKRWGKSKGIKLFYSQGKGNLGLRMRKQILKAQNIYKFKHNATKNIIIIGTDLPNLCNLDLIEAIESLKENSLVIGPSEDGGYWLLGIHGKILKPVPGWLFSGIPWGQKSVLSTTIIKAQEKGVKFSLLKQHNDIDEIEDLKPWTN